MKKYLSIAALALVGAMMTGCSNEDDGISNPQQPENQSKSVTLTATIGLDGGTTRALTETGVKTFADGETMAVIYKNNSGNTVKAVSNPLNGSSDIAEGGKKATFTFTLDDPDRTQNVTYIYPAAMAGETDVDYTKLNSQSGGTLADLGSKYDLCTKSGAWNGVNLPTLTLENQLAILAVTLKNSDGSSDITGSVTRLMVNDGTYTYYVDRSAAAGPIYVAIRPTADATINITAKTSTGYHVKTLTDKTYAQNNGYNVSWKMTELPEGALPGKFTMASGKQVYFSKGNLRAYFASAGSSCTWDFAPNQWSRVADGSANVNIDGNGTVGVGGFYVDLFGWVGASSSWTGTAMYGISNSTTSADYGTSKTENLKSDWGTLIGSGWRTPTGGGSGEWYYLFNSRTYAYQKYGHGSVNGVKGMIILPDTWTLPTGLSFTAGNSGWTNSYTTEQWAQMETAGAVFLPAAGRRTGQAVAETSGVNLRGYYWSSSPSTLYKDSAHEMLFQSNAVSPESDNMRYCGMSVRLVRDVE